MLAAFSSLHAATQRYVIHCQRVEPTQVRCDYFSAQQLLQDSPVQSLGQTQQAIVDVEDTSEGQRYQTILLDSQEQVGVKATPTLVRHKVEAQVNEINEFLGDSTQTELVSPLYAANPLLPFAIFCSLCLETAGIIAAFCTPFQIKFQRDADSHELSVKWRYLLRTQQMTVTLTDISEVITQTTAQPRNIKPTDIENPFWVYEVQLSLKSGSRVKVDRRMLTENNMVDLTSTPD